ncbi:MAG TPA: lipocalin-like domain-containing protein [Candidatus Acidoferrum sp.]|nr:lipocalin-like domain-containing protein [Candidatus Acidoferrum sp.]
MKTNARAWILLLLCSWTSIAQTSYKVAMPGYRYEFPRDHFDHPEFQTEWWYYTGNLTASDGHRFGFELTFFREGVDRDSAKTNVWDLQDLYLAHLALSDLSGKTFYHSERTNRSGPGIAGIDAKQGRIWNGNWSATWNGDVQTLRAVEERFSFLLKLQPEKPPVIHGENGISQKAEGAGHASHYISLTRIKTDGTIQLQGRSYSVAGLAWMDHEFFTHQMTKNQVGWDWFSLQLGDSTEVMLYRIRRADGSVDPFSSGTFIDASGHSVSLKKEDFSLTPSGETWKSPMTGATYPIAWAISIPKLSIELKAATTLPSQELTGNSKTVPNYWEGAIDLIGRRGNTELNGVGYLELTGYDRSVTSSGL